MNQRRDDAREFAATYFGVKLSTLHTSRLLKSRIRNLQTIIIDTASLTSGAMKYSHAWSLEGGEVSVLAAAADALAGHRDETAIAMREATPHDSPFALPVETGSSDATYHAAYHAGREYYHAIIGSPARLLDRCNLTENEIEHINLTARKQTQEGNVVYVVATTHTAHASLGGRDRLEFVGIMCYRYSLYPGIHAALTRLRDMGYTLLYASRDDEMIVSTLAAQSGFTSMTLIPSQAFSPGQTLYAELSEREFERLLTHYPAESSLVVEQPLPRFVQLLSAMRSKTGVR